MKELLAKLGLRDDLTEAELLERLKERPEEVREYLNEAKDTKLIRQLAELGLTEVQFRLGLMYKDGWGVKQIDRLSFRSEEGWGVKQSDRQAAKWFRKAAGQGHVNAQHNLGVMYEQGLGVEQDYCQAAEWFRKAAGQGDAGAQHNLGLMYEQGLSVERDDRQAAEWYR